MVKIRLQRVGKKKAPFYHIVVADSKSPRDGKIIEKIGSYNPMTDPATVVYQGETVEAIVDGAFEESTLRSAPYFQLRIDGITEDAEAVE